MIIPEKTRLAGDTCLKDTVRRFYKQHQEEPHKWDEPLVRARGLVNYYSYNFRPYYLSYYQAVLKILETQETTTPTTDSIKN